MKVAFLCARKKMERQIAEAFLIGVRKRGDKGDLILLDGEQVTAHGYDVAVMFGVKSRDMFRANAVAGICPVMVDKGYIRRPAPGQRKCEYWRVSVGAHHPTSYLMRRRHRQDRLRALDITIAPWRETGGHIVIAGSSAKYHRFYDLEDPTDYARALVENLRRFTDRKIVYRPKPSWREAVPVRGTVWSRSKRSMAEDLEDAHALVTHGSNACFDAITAGVPAIVLGDGVAQAISSTAIEDIESPQMVSDATRRQWLANIAYQQWTIPEFSGGEPWERIVREVHHWQPPEPFADTIEFQLED